MAGGMPGYPTAAGSLGGRKRKKVILMGGGWYMFYGKLSVKQMGPRSSQVVLHLHLMINLLHHGTVCLSMRIPQRQPAVYWVILMGTV